MTVTQQLISNPMAVNNNNQIRRERPTVQAIQPAKQVSSQQKNGINHILSCPVATQVRTATAAKARCNSHKPRLSRSLKAEGTAGLLILLKNFHHGLGQWHGAKAISERELGRGERLVDLHAQRERLFFQAPAHGLKGGYCLRFIE